MAYQHLGEELASRTAVLQLAETFPLPSAAAGVGTRSRAGHVGYSGFLPPGPEPARCCVTAAGGRDGAVPLLVWISSEGHLTIHH